MHYEPIVFALVALFWIIRGIFKFLKWAGQQLKGSTAVASPAQMVPPPSQVPPSSQTLPTRAPTLASPRLMPRQPQAGGLAVERETTERDFRRQEDDLVASEPTALGVSLESPTPAAIPVKALFGSSDDLVRAIILREALGPPLSRRRLPSASPPPS